MNGKGKETICGIFSLVVSGVLALGAWAVGLKISGGGPVWRWAFLVALGAAGVMAAANIARENLFKKKWEGLTAQQIIDKGLEYKQRIEGDLQKAEKELKKTIRIAYLWAAAAAVLLVFSCFALGAASAGGKEESALGGGIAIMIVMLFLLTGFVFLLCAPCEKSSPAENTELRREDYPRIYECVERAAKDAGCKKRVRLAFTDGGFSIAEGEGCVFAYIDAVELSLFTERELYAVMLHEFAHVRNADTAGSRRYGKIVQRWAGDGNEFLSAFVFSPARGMFLSYYGARIYLEHTAWRELSSRSREIRADAFVKEKGYGRDYVNATAKSSLLLLYRDSVVRERDFDVYEGEAPVGDYYTRALETFKKYRAARREFWDFILRHELPARIDTHPTFRMRMEHMGETDYDVETSETDETYAAEQKKALDYLNVLFVDFARADYMQSREQYLAVREKMRAYEKAKEEGRELSVSELADYIGIYAETDEDETLILAEKLMEKSPDSPLAAYHKGAVLARRGDEAAIPLLYRAARASSELSSFAMDAIGKFALRMGRQDLLDEYRAQTPAIMQSSLDFAADARWKKKDKFCAAEFSAEARETLRAAFLSLGQGKIGRVRSVKKLGKDKKPVYLYAVEFTGKPAPREEYEIMDATYRYLLSETSDGGRFSLFDARSARALVNKMLRDVPECTLFAAEEEKKQNEDA